MAIAPGTEIAGYRVDRAIGAGGMASVYLAERLVDGQAAALKVLRDELAADDAYRRRFLRESRYAELLDHPNVVKVLGAGEHGDLLFIAMEYVEGTDLHGLIREGGLTRERSLSILRQVAGALDAAHEQGLLHRDVKAANVLVAGERAWLADFGLSKHTARDSVALTALGTFVGTIHYTAPEQILGDEVGPAVDVYSLGCLLYECVTGEPPFSGLSETEVMQAHIQRPPPSLGEEALDAVIAKALAKDPAERWESCAALVAAAADAVGLVAMDKLRLKVTAGNATGTEIEVDDELLIGRMAEGEGRLGEDIEISRRHARIARGEDGAYAVEDLGSTNGTIVNGHRIDKPELLYPGDTIEVGATKLVVQVTAGPPPASTEVEPPAEPPESEIEPQSVVEEAPPVEPRMALTLEVEGMEPVKLVYEDGQWRIQDSA
jgi:pSer/pThr/pTyr-binding forkhead associated (FHA) protein/tRNA A-37 threonylcarbamoyl transferase component Bud32